MQRGIRASCTGHACVEDRPPEIGKAARKPPFREWAVRQALIFRSQRSASDREAAPLSALSALTCRTSTHSRHGITSFQLFQHRRHSASLWPKAIVHCTADFRSTFESSAIRPPVPKRCRPDNTGPSGPDGLLPRRGRGVRRRDNRGCRGGADPDRQSCER